MRTNLIYAIRNILKNSINSIITVVGLSVAIACCLIIYFYVSQEYSFNNFHKNAGNIYRINYELGYVEGTDREVRLEPEIADQLPKEVPQIDKCTEYRFAFENVLDYNNIYYDAQMGYAGADFFEIFSFDFIVGNKSELFKNPYEIVITKKLADKIIADSTDYEKLLGDVVKFPLAYGTQEFIIVGVMADIPKNSSINFDAVVSGKSGRNFGGCDNNFGYTSVYYKLKDKANPKDAEKNVDRFIKKYYKALINEMKNRNQLVNTEAAFTPFVLPLKDVYLENSIGNCFESTNSRRNFSILITIGLLILIIACSNYTILSLGQYLKKIGDVGIRKAMGARSSNIFSVFFSEGVILTFASFIMGLILCFLFIPVFGKLALTEIYTQLIDVPKVVIFIILSFFGIVFFTSIIPVIVFSKVSPHQMAGNKITVGNKSKLSQVFVSFQYSVSIILIVVTIFIVRQSNYLKNRALGLNTENIIDIQIDRVENDQITLFQTLLEENPGVLSLTKSSRNFMNGSSDSFVDKGDGEQITVFRFEVDDAYLPTLGLKLINGENFTKENIKPNDKSMIVNAKFVEMFDIKDNPIGKTYNINGLYFTIIGVVDNYHFSNMKRKIRPLMLYTRTNYGNNFNNILLKIQPDQLDNVKKHIEKCYEKVAPGKTLTYNFWDEKLRDRYQEEERWSKIIGYSSVIAIIISSLGLFGLTILLINQRIKEIGVRKVNGAKSIEVLLTINKGFMAWLVGSMLIAGPIAYYIVNKWLDNFPYKVEVSWWVFILAGTLAILVALFTVSWQSWKAATRNPVEALRYE